MNQTEKKAQLQGVLARLHEEEQTLGARLEKLNAFIPTESFKALETTDQFLLTEQQRHMTGYHDTLQKRLSRLENHPLITGVPPLVDNGYFDKP